MSNFPLPSLSNFLSSMPTLPAGKLYGGLWSIRDASSNVMYPFLSWSYSLNLGTSWTFLCQHCQSMISFLCTPHVVLLLLLLFSISFYLLYSIYIVRLCFTFVCKYDLIVLRCLCSGWLMSSNREYDSLLSDAAFTIHWIVGSRACKL